MIEKIVVPALGESITEATVSKWLKNEGDSVNADEPIVELETDKVNLEVPSPISGVLSEINFKNTRPSATCLYSLASMLPRSISAAANNLASKLNLLFSGMINDLFYTKFRFFINFYNIN